MRTLLLPLLLAACSTGAGLSDRLAGHDRVQGDGDGVAITGFASRVEALPLAIAHCARFSRSAQFDRRDADGSYRFRCVSG